MYFFYGERCLQDPCDGCGGGSDVPRNVNVISSGGDANAIRQQAISEGMRSLRKDALEKLYQGITTPEEIVRVTRAS